MERGGCYIKVLPWTPKYVDPVLIILYSNIEQFIKSNGTI